MAFLPLCRLKLQARNQKAYLQKINVMKTLWLAPSWAKVLFYFLVLWVATAVAGTIPRLNDFLFFFLIALFMSWALLKLDERTLSSIGFWPKDKKSVRDFFQGLGIGVVMLLITFVLTLCLTKDNWSIRKHIDPIFIMVTFLVCLWSAFVQEFVFRGYPFQTLLRNYRPWIAQLLIAVPFGLMHVSSGMQTKEVVMVMLSTGMGSILFGLAFLKSRNLMFPIGIHLGWNYAQELIPRTAGAKNSALVIIQESNTDYNMFNISLPYFFVVISAIILILKFKQTSIKDPAS